MSSGIAVDKLSTRPSWFAADEELVEQLRAGSQEAYAYLVEHYQHSIYNLTLRLLGNPHEAADMTQEVFIKIYRGIHGFNGDSNLRTWIYRIAVHEAANWRRWWLRHRGNRTVSLDLVDPEDGETRVFDNLLPDHAPLPSDQVMHAELESRLQAALNSLPIKYRTAVILRDVEGLSYEDIASTLHISIGTVKSRILRGRDLLRDKLKSLMARERSSEGLRKWERGGYELPIV